MNNSSFVFHVSGPQNGADELVSAEQYNLIVKALVFGQIFFSLLGVITNIINIRVYVEQGVTTTNTNIGLFSLSVFDFMSCLLMLPSRICVMFDFTDDWPNTRLCKTHAAYCTFVYIIFYYCSNWTTVYLSVERALCVVIPLKVKLLLKPKVTVVVIISIFILFSTAQLTYAGSTNIVWRVYPRYNLSLPWVGENAFAKEYLYYYSLAMNAFFFTLAMFIVLVTTSIMIHTLLKYQKWRQNNAGMTSSTGSDAPTQKESISSKDAEMIKSVTIVTSIYLVCLSIGHIPSAVVILFPGATYSGKNKNLFFIAYVTRFLFSLLNSSINFFFYVRISSRYKAAFSTAFPRLSRYVDTTTTK